MRYQTGCLKGLGHELSESVGLGPNPDCIPYSLGEHKQVTKPLGDFGL